MVKVITYGTYDLLHYGHIRLLERAKALGDYLIVGVTADGFDLGRGKINVQQSLMERLEAVKATGLADEIIVEEYEGQKIDDILRHNVDIFAIGSDWGGKFDYLNEFCKVVYLERTQGVSSSDLRAEMQKVKIAIVGEEMPFLQRVEKECGYVNGIESVGIFSSKDYDKILPQIDAVYLNTIPIEHNIQIEKALSLGKHILCDSPISTSVAEWERLNEIAKKNGCVLMDAIRTAYSTAYYRLILLVKSGRIGKVASIDASCTTLRNTGLSKEYLSTIWNSICAWGPTAMLPIFQLLGPDYLDKHIYSKIIDEKSMYDQFTNIVFRYEKAVASIKVGKGVKTEGELIITGTEGYIYVPAPWWKTEYFEIRREDSSQDRRYFYQLEGEGLRYAFVSFLKSIRHNNKGFYVSPEISKAICKVIEDYYAKRSLIKI